MRELWYVTRESETETEARDKALGRAGMTVQQQEAGERWGGKATVTVDCPVLASLSSICTFSPCRSGGHSMPAGKIFVPGLRDSQEGMRKQERLEGNWPGKAPSCISCQPLGHDLNLPLTS